MEELIKQACIEITRLSFAQVLHSVRVGGTLLNFGAMSGLTFTANVPDVSFLKKTICGFWLLDWFCAKPNEEQDEIAQQVRGLATYKPDWSQMVIQAQDVFAQGPVHALAAFCHMYWQHRVERFSAQLTWNSCLATK